MEREIFVNKQHKDRFFVFLFGNERHKEWTLSLYNAINGTSYSNPDDINFNTIDDVIYMGMKNDISFIIDDEVDIFEHQSTYNPNMPVRQLIYLAKLYEGYISQGEESIYSSTLLKLPTPKFVVFYNGTKNTKDELVLKLSDSFKKGSKPDVEVKVRMININSNKSNKLLQNCQPLKEYALFIEEIRKGMKTKSLSKSIDDAILNMPDDYIIKNLIIKHRAEVKGMLLTEYNETAERKKLANSVKKKTEEKNKKLMVKILTKNSKLSKAEATRIIEEEFKKN